MPSLVTLAILGGLVLGLALLVLAALLWRQAAETNRLLRLLCRSAGQETEPRTGREFSR